MGTEKKIISEHLGSYYFDYDSIIPEDTKLSFEDFKKTILDNLEKLREGYLNMLNDTLGEDFCEEDLTIEYIQDVDYDYVSNYLIIYRNRLETDKEYEGRLKKEKYDKERAEKRKQKAKERAAQKAAQKAAKKAIEEKKLYEELKKKFEG